MRVVNIVVLTSIFVFSIGFYEGITQNNLFSTVIPIDSKYLTYVRFNSIRFGHLRIQSTFSNTLALSQYCIILLPIVFIFVKSRKSLLGIYIGIFTGILLLFNVINTYSRTGILLSVIFIIFLILIKPYKKILLNKSIIYLSIRYFLPPIIVILSYFTIIKIIAIINDRALLISIGYTYRLLQYAVAIPYILESPIWGYGVGSAATKVIGIGNQDGLTVDNYYLTIGAESGIIALILFIFILSYSIKLGLSLNFKSIAKEKLLLFGISTSILLFSINLITLSLKQNFPFLFLLLAVLVVMNNLPSKTHQNNMNQRLKY